MLNSLFYCAPNNNMHALIYRLPICNFCFDPVGPGLHRNCTQARRMENMTKQMSEREREQIASKVSIEQTLIILIMKSQNLPCNSKLDRWAPKACIFFSMVHYFCSFVQILCLGISRQLCEIILMGKPEQLPILKVLKFEQK